MKIFHNIYYKHGFGEGAMGIFWQDPRYATRTLFKRPGLTLIVIITLAI